MNYYRLTSALSGSRAFFCSLCLPLLSASGVGVWVIWVAKETISSQSLTENRFCVNPSHQPSRFAVNSHFFDIYRD